MATGRVPTTANSPLTAKGDLFTYSTAPARLAVGNSGEQIVADSSTSTGLRYQASFAAAKNKIINGSFDIAQRGTSFTGGQYGLDRFNSGAGSNAFTITQVAGIGGSRFAAKLTQTGSNAFTQFGTQIEFANCYDLQNQTVTISFVAQANNANTGSTAFVVRTRTIAGVDGACLFVGTASDTSITLTTTATTYTVTRTLPATFGSLSLEFSTGSGVTGDGYTITNIQMERGSVATAFTRTGGNIQGELAACQRYFYKTYPQSVTPGTATNYIGSAIGTALTTAAMITPVRYAVTMRTTPTITIYHQDGTVNKVYYILTGAGVTVTGSSYASDGGFWQIDAASTLTANAVYYWHYTASAEL